MGSGYNASSTAKNVVLRCLMIIGNRDHFGHFFLDFFWPLYHWLYTRGRLHDANLNVYFSDKKIEKFRPFINEVFDCRVVTDFSMHQVEGFYRDMVLGMESCNRKTFNLTLLDYVGNPRQYIQDFRAYMHKKLGLEVKGQSWFVLIERKKEAGDRGGSRRNISNHDELAATMEALAVELGFKFKNAILEDMSFREQAQLFANSKVVVGQHGAAFCHLFWMPDGSIIHEINGTDKETYRFGQICSFFKHVQHKNMVCPVDKNADGVTQEALLVDCPSLSRSIRQIIQRKW